MCYGVFHWLYILEVSPWSYKESLMDIWEIFQSSYSGIVKWIHIIQQQNLCYEITISNANQLNQIKIPGDDAP